MLDIANVREKIAVVEKHCNLAFKGQSLFHQELIPEIPARDISVRPPDQHPNKKGLSFKEGQARLLHDLANIELQAMELGFRTLCEFPEAPEAFKEELIAVVKSESEHLTLCLDGLEKVGFKWGDWPVHTVLWQAVAKEDSLLDRILIVHRYLEGSGLDAGDALLKRLHGVAEGTIHSVVKTIVTEEIGHVEFGSRWYRALCEKEKVDPQQDFPDRIQSLRIRLPRRIERISRPLREKAGFTDFEISYLEDLRNRVALHP